MKNNMEEIDHLIKDTLTQEEAKFYDSLEEQNLIGMLMGLYSGKNAWMIIMMNIVTFIFFGLFVYCCIQFFNTDAVAEMMKWGFGSLIFLIGSCLLKMYAWMQMDKNALLREMKRLELQVMSLSGKM